MITTIYNTLGDKIDLEITGYNGSFEVISIQVQTNDISDEIFTGILGTELTVNILSKDDTIYNGSLIGKEINLTINDSATRHYTIITNVASMPANFVQEEIEIAAVDDITMLKNKRYDGEAFITLREIIGNIMGNFIILDGWGGTTPLLELTFNTGCLVSDGGNTLPTQYEVLEAISKYINRSVFYDYTDGCLVFFNANKTDSSQNAVKVIDGVSTEITYSVPEIIINSETIAEADRNVTLSDPWQSAEITCKYEDIKSSDVKATYTSNEDTGIWNIGSTKIKYSMFFGDNGGNTFFAPSIGSVNNLTVENIARAVDRGEYGACMVQLATAELSGENDVEGSRSGDEYIMLYGCLNTPTYKKDLFEHLINTDTITDNDTKLILSDTVIYSDFPFPYTKGTFTCYYPNVIMDVETTGKYNDIPAELRLDFPGNNASQGKGQPLSTENTVTWASKLRGSGTVVNLQQGNAEHISQVKIKMYPCLWHFNSNVAGMSARPSQYEFHKVSAKIERRAKVDEEVFETDTVIKAINDGANGITINGKEIREKAKFVTFDGKKAGNNCVYYSLGLPLSWIKYYKLNEAMSDDARYYSRDKCTSEERFIGDINSHYFQNLFSESITLNGIQPLFANYKDAYFAKNKMILTNATINITEGTTKINVQEL